MSTEETKANESVPLEDIPNKTDETTPLTTKEAEATEGGGADENNVSSDKTLEEKLDAEAAATAEAAGGKRKSLTNRLIGADEISLSNPRVRLLLAILASLLLFFFLLTAILIVLRSNDDTTYRYLRIVPRPRGPNNMISFRHGASDKSYLHMVDEISEFLGPYRRAPDEAMLCPNRNKTDSHVCLFDINGVARECLKPDYGYPEGNPCIFIVFNNISDWIPKGRGPLASIECRANNVVDDENIGSFELTPFHGFPAYFFPYTGHPNYMAPFVALRLSKPSKNIGIGVTCALTKSNFDENDDLDSEPVPHIPFNIFIE